MQSLTLNLLGKSTECCSKTLIYSILLVGSALPIPLPIPLSNPG